MANLQLTLPCLPVLQLPQWPRLQLHECGLVHGSLRRLVGVEGVASCQPVLFEEWHGPLRESGSTAVVQAVRTQRSQGTRKALSSAARPVSTECACVLTSGRPCPFCGFPCAGACTCVMMPHTQVREQLWCSMACRLFGFSAHGCLRAILSMNQLFRRDVSWCVLGTCALPVSLCATAGRLRPTGRRRVSLLRHIYSRIVQELWHALVYAFVLLALCLSWFIGITRFWDNVSSVTASHNMHTAGVTECRQGESSQCNV